MDPEIEFADDILKDIHSRQRAIMRELRDYRAKHPWAVNPLSNAVGAASEVLCCIAGARHCEGVPCAVLKAENDA